MLPERRERDPWLPALALVPVIAASVVSAFISLYAGWACSSGEEATGSLEADLCDGLYDGASASGGWWVAVFWPVVAFGLSQFLPTFRRRPLVIATPLAILVVAFWITTAVVVIDV